MPPFGGPPLSYKAPPRQFQLPECKLTPSKTMYIGEGKKFCVILHKNCTLGVAIPFLKSVNYMLESANLHFGGRSCLGRAAKKRGGGIPKRGVLWVPEDIGLIAATLLAGTVSNSQICSNPTQG